MIYETIRIYNTSSPKDFYMKRCDKVFNIYNGFDYYKRKMKNM